jgi:hypothetical protein
MISPTRIDAPTKATEPRQGKGKGFPQGGFLANVLLHDDVENGRGTNGLENYSRHTLE